MAAVHRVAKQLDNLHGAAQQLAKLVEEMSASASATPVLTPADEIYNAFERGVIEAGEWVGPRDDLKLAIERLRTELEAKVELVPFPHPVLRDLKRLAVQVVKEHSETSPLARRVHASFTKFQAQLGPWDHVAQGAYHELFKE